MKKPIQVHGNQKLLMARLSRNWTQRDVADRLGTTRLNVCRWERGYTIPSAYFRYHLCRLFEMDASELGFLQEEVDTASVDETLPAQSTRFWCVPFRRNPFFTGRQHTLSRLHQAFSTRYTTGLAVVQAISGMGGIGKTQTAIEYAYRYQANYRAVFWVRADTSETLLSDLATLIELLHLTETALYDPQAILRTITHWLNEHSEWLLILDRIENIGTIRDFLSSLRSGHILLLMRSEVTGTVTDPLVLEKMEPEEGAHFLLRRAKLISINTRPEDVPEVLYAHALGIVQHLDGLPLALDQAGAYLEETACELTRYLEYYQTRRSLLLGLRGVVIDDHQESVVETFTHAIAKVQQAYPAAIDLLRFCAFLHPNTIPERLIIAGASELGPVLQPVVSDPFLLDLAIKELRQQGLLRRHSESQTLTMHRLVQATLI